MDGMIFSKNVFKNITTSKCALASRYAFLGLKDISCSQ